MQKIIKSFFSVMLLVTILLLPCLSMANNNGPSDKLIKMGKESGFNTKSQNSSLMAVVGKVISVVLSLLGIVFLALFIYAGVLWMIAAGDSGKITTAKDTMRRAVVGLIIVVGSYAISQFVFYSLLK